MRAGRWKLVQRRRAQAPELYNPDVDLDESRDPAAERPRKVKELLDARDRWDAEPAEPKWPPPQS